jgi:hypothetical protein
MIFRQGHIFRIDRLPRLDIKGPDLSNTLRNMTPMTKRRVKNTGELRKIYTNGDSIQVCIPKRQAAEIGIKPGSYVKCFIYDKDRDLGLKEGDIVLRRVALEEV